MTRVRVLLVTSPPIEPPAALAIDPSIEVVAQAATGREAITLTRRHRPDVVLMDVQMPDLDGITAIQELWTRRPTRAS